MLGQRGAQWPVKSAVTALLLLGVAGCGWPATSSSHSTDSVAGTSSGSARASARPTASPSSVLPSPWASSSGSGAQRAAASAAVVAYDGMWEDLIAAGATSDFKDPRLASHMLYQPLTDWMQLFADDSGRGIVRGRNESLYPFCRRLNVWPRRLRQAAGPVLC